MSKNRHGVFIVFTVISELVEQDHPAVGQRGAAVAERHLDAVEDLSTRHIGGNGKHVDSRDSNPVLLSAGKVPEVNTRSTFRLRHEGQILLHQVGKYNHFFPFVILKIQQQITI